LAIEAGFLANVQHANIICIHGISRQTFDCPTDGTALQADGYFLVVDLLCETLSDRIIRWKTQHVSPSSSKSPANYLRFFQERRMQQRLQDLLDRVETLLPIALAMQHFHCLGFMYRDLKPDNIGFDTNGIIKLFDFGMASSSETRKDTSGSRRYMAPEVARRVEYDKSVDVFSFAILLWEVCALERPFEQLSREQHYYKVIQGTMRPKLEAWWPRELQTLLRQCWSRNAWERPCFPQIVDSLEGIMSRKRDRT